MALLDPMSYIVGEYQIQSCCRDRGYPVLPTSQSSEKFMIGFTIKTQERINDASNEMGQGKQSHISNILKK